MTMSLKLLTAAAVAAAVVTGTAALAAVQPIQFPLLEQNGSGEHGTATVLQGVSGLIVKVRMTGGGEGVDQPAHIHKGTCAKLDPKPSYPLRIVHDGQSETEITGVTLADLQKGTYAINVHKSTKEVPIYVSCGSIPAAK
jgi:opacity protein-like surface antigen